MTGQQLPKLSTRKNNPMTHKILIADQLDDEGLDILRPHAELVSLPTISQEELVKTIGEFDALIVRSRAKVTSRRDQSRGSHGTAARRRPRRCRRGQYRRQRRHSRRCDRRQRAHRQRRGGRRACHRHAAGPGAPHSRGRPIGARRRVEAQQIRWHRGAQQATWPGRPGPDRLTRGQSRPWAGHGSGSG